MAGIKEEQFDVNEPFDLESNPNDSDYRIVKRVKVEIGQSSLIQDLAKLFIDEKQTDFKIVCEGQTFQCHKAILAARSDVFYSMFQRSESKNKTGKVKKINDIDAKTMKSLLRYIYQNHFPEGGEVDMNLLNGAHKYNLAELVSHCQESIVKNISDETAWDIAVSSRLLAYQEIYEAAKKFINTHPSLKAGNDWQTFKKEDIKIAEKSTKKKSKKSKKSKSLSLFDNTIKNIFLESKRRHENN